MQERCKGGKGLNLKCALVHEAVKAFRDYQPARVHNGLFQDRPLRLFALGGQSACFQLMLQSDEEMLVCKDAHPAFYKGGMIDTVRAALDGSALPEGCRAELFLEGFVEDDDRTLKADILLDSSSLYVERRRVQPVFVVLSFPEGTPAGVYHGSIRVYVHTAFASERCEAELPFSVELSAGQSCRTPKAAACIWTYGSTTARLPGIMK